MGTLLSAANWPIVGQIAILLGKVMNVIYNTGQCITNRSWSGWMVNHYLHDSGIYIDAAADSQSAEDIKNDSSDES